MFKIAAALMIMPVLCLLLIATTVYRSGLLIVDVQNKISGNRIYLPVPMLLVNFAAGWKVRPLQNLRDSMQPLNNVHVREAFGVMAECPDTTFVEVENPHTTVVIAKKGADLTIHAESDKERVDVKVPIESAQRTITKLAAQL